MSRRDQAKLFQETLNDPEYNRARSLVIARTESTKSANFGINMGAESSDYEVQKFWINTKDKRTRRSHLLMTQDRIAINQPFIVGGTPMMYPGEVGAPAAEVVTLDECEKSPPRAPAPAGSWKDRVKAAAAERKKREAIKLFDEAT